MLPLKGSAKYREVIDVLRSFCEKMEIVFDEKAASRLQALERKQPTNDPFSTVTFAHILDNSVKLFVEIKPVINDDGWFASISLVDLTLFKEASPSSEQ